MPEPQPSLFGEQEALNKSNGVEYRNETANASPPQPAPRRLSAQNSVTGNGAVPTTNGGSSVPENGKVGLEEGTDEVCEQCFVFIICFVLPGYGSN